MLCNSAFRKYWTRKKILTAHIIKPGNNKKGKPVFKQLLNDRNKTRKDTKDKTRHSRQTIHQKNHINNNFITRLLKSLKC